MSKASPQLKYISPQVATGAGTYSNISSVVLNDRGVVITISTSSLSSTPVQGLVSAVFGDNSTTVVTTSTGNIQIGLAYSGSSTGTTRAIQTLTIDPYGRVQSISTSSIAAGTYTNIQSISIDSTGKIINITTGTSSFVPTNVSIINSIGSSNGAIFTGTTYINNVQESIYFSSSVNYSISSNGYTVNHIAIATNNGAIAYIDSPINHFGFDMTGTPFSASYITNKQYPTETGPAAITIIVNNTYGKSFAGVVSSGGQFSPTYSIKWLGGYPPTGVAGRIEIFTLLFPRDGYTVYASMATYG